MLFSARVKRVVVPVNRT